MVIKTTTAIVSATITAAIVLFEPLLFSNWITTMMINMILHKQYSYNNNNYFPYPQSVHGDRKNTRHYTTVVAGGSYSNAVSAGTGNGDAKTGFPAITMMMMMEDSRPPSSISSSSSKNKLTHTSFRIEENVIKSLERAAEKRGISLSSLVNKILKNYVTSEMYFEELGFILVSKNFLRKTYDELNTDQIEKLGKEYGLTIAREYISYFYPQVNSITLVQFLDVWFKRFQSCQHRIDGDDANDSNNDKKRHYYTVNHDINMNFSLALQSMLGGLIEPIIKSTVEFINLTSTSITFSFQVRL